MTPRQLFDHIGHGGKSTVARWCGLSPSAMTIWADRDKIPAEYCKLIEDGSRGYYPRYILRPDLWDPPWVKSPAPHDGDRNTTAEEGESS